jgi:hypothetical protein
MQNTRYLSLVLLAVSPVLLAARCHFGADDVSLGANTASSGGAPDGGQNTPSAGTGSSGGTASVAGSGPNDESGGEGGDRGADAGRGSGADAGRDSGSAGTGSSAAGSSSMGGTAGAAFGGTAGEAGRGPSTAGNPGAGGLAGEGGSAGTGGSAAGTGGYTGSNIVGYWICGLTGEPTAACGEPMGEFRYAFNPVSMGCEQREGVCDIPFQNRFGTMQECERNCADYAWDDLAGGPVPKTVADEPAACIVPPLVPDCDIAPESYAYFFDPRTGECVTQPCLPEGSNHFRSLEECEEACKPKFENGAVDATAVVEGSSCEGFGDQVSDATSAETFTLTGSVLSRSDGWWGCGCPSRAQHVLVYEPTSPLRLRLCDDMFASICQQTCMAELEWDLSRAFDVAGTTEFVFVD